MSQTSPSRPSLNPSALTLADAAEVLSKASGKVVSLGTIQSDVDAGAPTNADGTINLIHYAAWLVREVARGD